MFFTRVGRIVAYVALFLGVFALFLGLVLQGNAELATRIVGRPATIGPGFMGEAAQLIFAAFLLGTLTEISNALYRRSEHSNNGKTDK